MKETMQIEVDDLKWIAQTVHQGYHTTQPATFADCPKSVCKFVTSLLVTNSLRGVSNAEEEKDQSFSS